MIFGLETSEFTLLTVAPFVAIRQKSAYHAKYLRMSWTTLYLDLLYRFGRRNSGMIFQIFIWRSPKGRCYGNQLNMGDVSKRCMESPLLFVLAFDNVLADRKSVFKRFSGNNRAIRIIDTKIRIFLKLPITIVSKCGELPSSNLGVYAVKMRNFCRDSPAI